MKFVRMILASMLALAMGLPGYADDAHAAYQRGVSEESKKEYDKAFESFQQAYVLHPKEPKYVTAFLRTRSAAASQHVNTGVKLRENQKMQEALAEFQRATQIDGTNFAAVQEVQRTLFLMKKLADASVANGSKPSTAAKQPGEVEGPMELEPSPNTPITLHMTTAADNIYRTIAKLGGINVLFDLDYKPQRITIDLNEVMMRDALRMLAMESKTYWRAISPTTIFVSAESKRKEFESSVMKTFYLRNVSNAAELQEVVGTLKGMLDINRIQVNSTHSSITVRGTPDQMLLAEKLIGDVDKPKAEVIVDVAVMQVSRDRLNTLGTNVPTSTSVALVDAASIASSGGAASLVKLGSLNGSSFVTPVPSASFTFLASDGNTKILQRPQIRAIDNEKATLKIGDRVPIATGSFSAGVGGGGYNPLVNTQFQYLDVGVNIDITPHVHSNHEVTLKLVLEISSVTGNVNLGGISQPIIGQRRIEHEMRLEDGDINLVGGILEDSETQSLSGYPWLTKIPILKYLFGQETKDHRQDEIVFAITPHIVRSQDITDENQKLIEVGTGNTIGLRYKEPPATSGAPGQPSSRNHTKPAHVAQAHDPGPPPVTQTPIILPTGP